MQADETYQRPSIYMQLEVSTSDAEDAAEEDNSSELRLIPSDSSKRKTSSMRCMARTHKQGTPLWATTLPEDSCSRSVVLAVQEIFQVLCDCAAMNPDASQEGWHFQQVIRLWAFTAHSQSPAGPFGTRTPPLPVCMEGMSSKLALALGKHSI